MKLDNLQDMTVEQLTKQFTAIVLEQDRAIRADETAKYDRLYRQMRAIEGVLKSRAGDQRRALLPLYNHANAQVRLAAAKATLAVAPQDAREMLQSIQD